jgi:hypothetical protein
MAGAKMGIFEKIDTARHRRDINLCRPVSQPDATGFSGAEPEAIEPIPSAFIEDYSTGHTIPGRSVTPTLIMGTQTATVSKEIQE